MDTVLKTINLKMTYGAGETTVEALKEGDFIVIVGPSGSGKSTLLHLLGGLEYPTKGKVMIASRANRLLKLSGIFIR